MRFVLHTGLGALRGEFLMVASLPWVSTGLSATREILVSEILPLLKTSGSGMSTTGIE